MSAVPDDERPKTCRYCKAPATCFVGWLQDKRGCDVEEPILVLYCGVCDLQAALRRFWKTPHPVILGTHYVIKELDA